MVRVYVEKNWREHRALPRTLHNLHLVAHLNYDINFYALVRLQIDNYFMISAMYSYSLKFGDHLLMLTTVKHHDVVNEANVDVATDITASLNQDL